jgi:putative acetyltransferase
LDSGDKPITYYAMIRTIRTSAEHPDFRELVGKLDEELSLRDGAEHPFYAQFNRIDLIPYVIIAYEAGRPVGCGAIKKFSDAAMEVKRMYVLPEWRGKGIASEVLANLEHWAKELGYVKCVLETGKRQPEAIELYTRRGYAVIANYGQYAKVPNSVCFEKFL